MKYYLTIVQNDSVCACYAYESRSAAMAAYHTELAYRADGRASTLCIVVNSNGTVIACDKYTAPPPAAVPDAEDGEN